jgi:catalase
VPEEKILTNDFGIPVPDNDHSLTAGTRGPILMQDHFLLEKNAQFNRERIPERVVHAKGAGAHGYFEVTNDVTPWTKAKFLGSVGKKTPVFARFSTVGGESGSADTVRDPRGFSAKFYTEEGNYDLVMNNTPVFFIRDPMKFPDFIHTQKRNPQTHAKDRNAFWDFLALTPESTHQVTVLMSDRGTPKSLREMNGYSGHTFKWINAEGKAVWVKYHFKTETGIANFTRQEAEKMAGANPDYHLLDLFNHIDGGGEAAWKVSVQILPLDAADNYPFDIFDITKVVSHKDYPLIEVGRFVLNRNPQNYFAEVEQAAFSPSNVVPGIDFSPDKMLQGRLMSYGDAHRYRLGSNYALIPINCPFATQKYNHQADGLMRVDDNGGNAPNYEPNSFSPAKSSPTTTTEDPYMVQGEVRRTPYQYPNDDFVQAGNLYRLMTDDQKARLIDNIVDHMGPVRKDIQLRQICNFFRADRDYGSRVAQGLGMNLQEEMSKMQMAMPVR